MLIFIWTTTIGAVGTFEIITHTRQLTLGHYLEKELDKGIEVQWAHRVYWG